LFSQEYIVILTISHGGCHPFREAAINTAEANKSQIGSPMSVGSQWLWTKIEEIRTPLWMCELGGKVKHGEMEDAKAVSAHC
jgi:hypothetical protein